MSPIRSDVRQCVERAYGELEAASAAAARLRASSGGGDGDLMG